MRRRTALSTLSALAMVAGMGAFVWLSGGTASAVTDPQCRPDGLYVTPGVNTPYCKAYDSAGREKMGTDHKRRIIGYFTGWRTGKNGQPAYLVKDIPWTKVTHVNYAFAHVDSSFKISVGGTSANNPATGMTWPGVAGAEMDPTLSYQGHFNLLTKYKKANPNVKVLISVGGWAETGGYFDDAGNRVDSGGFYRMTTTSSNTVNTSGINTFATSVVSFLRKYHLDGVDIDYEYPTSMSNSGNPLDFGAANARRAGLNKSYPVLMKTLRDKLNAAAAADGKYYLLTVAAPSSGYLLRGQENFVATQYLDYINVMSYDLHGAWNDFVGPNAALYDNGDDAELKFWNVYGTSQYDGQGYLNTDWAYHYFRGAVQAGRINIGVPFYTRGFKGVSGGTNGLWGTAPLPDQSKCPDGTGSKVGSKVPCGNGATGIDNIWHDLDASGKELGAGSNPMWHAKNLEHGITGDYLAAYGVTEKLTGTYTRNYSAALVAPWLWNAQKKVFLSTEDDQSLAAKADYVVGHGIGGVMFWELAGDYAFDATKKQYFIGPTLTTLLYDKFKTASAYGNKRAKHTMPTQVLDVRTSLGGFALGDNNYPISPKLTITNNSTVTIPGSADLQFDYPVASPANMVQQSGWSLTVLSSEHTGPNKGGYRGDFHHVSLKFPSWQTLAPGASVDVQLTYYMPFAGPSNFTLTFGGQTYALAQDYPRTGTAPTGSPTPSKSSSSPPSHACTIPAWDTTKVYVGGDRTSYKSHNWTAKWWTQGQTPGTADVWQDNGGC